MNCRFVELMQCSSRHTGFLKGPGALPLEQVLFMDKVTHHTKWCNPWAPGLEFGPGTLVFASRSGYARNDIVMDHLFLLATTNHYIDLNHYERVGNPPMITILNPPANWTLENGVFKEADNGNRDHFVQIPSRSEA